MNEQRTTPANSVESGAYNLLCMHLDNLPLAVVEWDSEFRFCRWSHHAETLFGWPASEVIGLHPRDFSFVHPDDRSAVDGVIGRLLRGEEERNISRNRNVSRDGKVIDCEWHNSVQRDSNGRMISVLSLVRDVTDLQRLADQTQSQLQRYRSEDERWRTLFSEAAAGILQTNIQNVVQYANRAFCAMVGRSEAEVVGSITTLLVHPDELNDQQVLQEHLLTGAAGHQVFERRLLHTDGHTVWARVSVTAQRDPQGKILGMIAVVEDISGERELAVQLRESQRLEAIGQLTGGLAHDFNNLLTVVLGNADLLCEVLPPESTERELASTILESAERGANLTRRLLAFARGQVLDTRQTDINALLRDFLELLRRTLGEAISVQFCPQEPLGAVVTDSTQLESALLNICLNARDAMPDGGTLTIETRDVALDASHVSKTANAVAGDYVRISISDTGTGIPLEQQHRVFEPFYTTKPRGKGTGLGLSMVFGFIKQSNGHVAIESAVGSGTTVQLYLPRSAARAIGEKTAQEPSERRPKGAVKILLVDDDSLVRDFVAVQLTAAGYSVLEAESGPAALAILHAQEHVDLLFTDLMMPGGMTGSELGEAARRSFPTLKILYTSGYAEQSTFHDGRMPPDIHFIAKPYRPVVLLQKLREALDA